MKEETRPKISLHLWYTDKADEVAAFSASNVEPGKHIGRLNVRTRIDHRDRNPPELWIASCAMSAPSRCTSTSAATATLGS